MGCSVYVNCNAHALRQTAAVGTEHRGKSRAKGLRRLRMVGHEDVGGVDARQQIRGVEDNEGDTMRMVSPSF
ncbi:MAG: hypothetical protein AUI48_13675 [Chloroflexi bacterium 13_1_40CM_2_68_14]|nr:MAG: hypothetical protein AUI48_13675 [Chloroflexi bacterium 13_1_40CM_2_68_14]